MYHEENIVFCIIKMVKKQILPNSWFNLPLLRVGSLGIPSLVAYFKLLLGENVILRRVKPHFLHIFLMNFEEIGVFNEILVDNFQLSGEGFQGSLRNLVAWGERSEI